MNKRVLYAAAGLLLSLQGQTLMAAGELRAGTKAFEAEDFSTALNELAPLAKEGNPDALNMLGQIYERGLSVSPDIEKAKQYYDRGAAKGHIPSVNSLRALNNKAFMLELKSVKAKADNNESHAQNRLGEMYEFGQGVDRDLNQAVLWYQKAANQGLIVAQHNMGRSYNFGTGVAQNYSNAEVWYLKAAEQGHTDAMFFLGTLYSNKHGNETAVDQNITAYAWMHNAAELGNQTAVAIERRLKMKLDEAQLKIAQNLATKYKAQYVTPYL